MKKRAVQLLLGFGMSLAVIGTAVPCFAAEETATESETAAETVAESESETETETETESDFVEGSAILSDYSYIKGDLTKDGWKSDFLKIEYVPEEKVTMGIDENAKMEEYYGRNGDDKKVADSEIDKAIVKAGSKVYEGKNENSRVVGKAKVRSLAYILADGDSEWIHIESGDCRGFVKSEDMITGNIAEFILSRDGALQDIYYTSLFFKAMAKHAYK